MATFRLDTLATLTAKHGELLYERLFGMRLIECRVLGVVRAYEPISLRRACIELGVDKSQGSRVVTRQVEAGLLERREDPEDQRSFYLLLTPRGRELIERIHAAAEQRNRDWLGGLPASLQATFADCLERQIVHARDMLDAELRRTHRAALPAPTHERVKVDAREPGPLLVERNALQDLHRKLGELLERSGGAA